MYAGYPDADRTKSVVISVDVVKAFDVGRTWRGEVGDTNIGSRVALRGNFFTAIVHSEGFCTRNTFRSNADALCAGAAYADFSAPTLAKDVYGQTLAAQKNSHGN